MKKTLTVSLLLLTLVLGISVTAFATSAPTCPIQIYGLVNQQNAGSNTDKAHILVKAADGSTATYKVGAQGAYEISDLKDGAYTIQAISEKRTVYLDSQAVAITVKDGKSSIGRLFLTLPKVRQDEYARTGVWPGGKQLVGRVDGPMNVLIEGRAVLTGPNGVVRTATIDVTDQFAFTGVKDGTYKLSIVSAKPNLYLTGGTTRTVVFRNGVCTPNRIDFAYCSTTDDDYVNIQRAKAAMPKGKVWVPAGLYENGDQLRGWFRGPNSVPFAGTVEINGRYGAFSVPVDSDGHFSAKGIPDGKYFLTGVPADSKTKVLTPTQLVTVADGACNPNGAVLDYAAVLQPQFPAATVTTQASVAASPQASTEAATPQASTETTTPQASAEAPAPQASAE